MISAAPVSPGSRESREQFRSSYIWRVSLSGALGGLLFGYDWVVIGGAKPFYETYFHLTNPLLQGWAVSCALLGCLLGALGSGWLADRYGRKPLLMLASVIFFASAAGTAFASSIPLFIVWRVVGGSAIGIASSLSPLYIAEMAPTHQRGRLVALNQLTVVVGILLAQVVNWRIGRPVPEHATALQLFASWNVQHGWRWMFGVMTIPATLFFFTAVFMPESPRWLAQKGFRARSLEILTRIGGPEYGLHVLEDVEQVRAQTNEKADWRELLRPPLGKVLALALVLCVLQQWCGINIIFNFAQEIFTAAGYRVGDIFFNIVLTGSVNLLFTVIALYTIDRVGRRPLLLGGTAGLVVIHVSLAILYHHHSKGLHMLMLVLSAIACYAVSLAAATWVVISEIFPGRIRGQAMSISITILWLACFLLTLTFPTLNSYLGISGTFLTYGGICVVGLIFLLRWLPETKNRSLEEIERSLEQGTAVHRGL